MLVTRHLEIEALVLLLLTVLRAGVPIMTLNGKSRIRRDYSSLMCYHHCRRETMNRTD